MLFKQVRSLVSGLILMAPAYAVNILALIFNTEVEATLNLSKVVQITDAVIRGSIAPKTHILIPASENVPHRDLATGDGDNIAFPRMLNQMHIFLETIH